MEEGKLFLSVTVLNCHDYLNFFSRRSFFRLSDLKQNFLVRSLSAKYRPDRYRRDKSVKFDTELP